MKNTHSPRRAFCWTACGLLIAAACGSNSSGGHDVGASGAQGGEADERSGAGAPSGGSELSPNEGGADSTRGGSSIGTEASGEGGSTSSAGAGLLGGASAADAGSGGEAATTDCVQPFARVLGAWDGRMPDGVCTVEHVCQVAPLPGNFEMKDIWGTLSSDLWVVGGRGSIVHFDGQKWTGIRSIGEPPLNQNGDGADFWSVHGTASNDVWVLGEFNQLLHFNGRRWSAVDYSGTIKARTLWAAARCDVWLFGDGGQASHFDGQTWTDMNVGSKEVLHDAFGFAPDDIWAVGGNTVVRWNGKNWTDASTGLEAYANLGAVWGANPDDVWAVGALKQFRKQKGGLWQKVRNTADLFGPFDVTGSAADDVLLPPQARFNGTSFDYDVVGKKLWSAGKRDYWSIDVVEKTSDVHLSHQTQPIAEYNREAFGVTFAPSVDTLYRSRLTGVGYTSVVEKRMGAQYVEQNTGLGSSYWLSGNLASDIWAVDNTSCDSSHFDGKQWTKAPSKLVVGPKEVPVATRVAVSPDNNAWFACNKQLAHFESGAWTLKKNFADPISRIAASDDKVWVVTRSTNGVIKLFELANGVVSPMLAPIEPAVDVPQLAGVDAAGRLWASSINGYVAFYSEGAWHNFPYRADEVAVRGNEVWFSEYPTNVTYRFDGVGMQPYSTVCGGLMSTPVIAGPGDVWFSNYGGMCHLQE